MGKLRHRGAEAANTGTYWNFETGEKVKLETWGLLPGDPSRSYYKVPPLLILSLAAIAAHLIMYVLPKFLMQFYSAYAEMLVTSYVVLALSFIAAVSIGIIVAGAGDILSGNVRWPSVSFGSLVFAKVRKHDDQYNRKH